MIDSKLFTFGCSMARYQWPMWSDMLGKEFRFFENWAQPGAGNTFIFYSLIECIKRNNISSKDTIVIMWTSVTREDRWISSRRWVTPGNIYNQNEYDKNFVKNWADPAGYLIRDLALISAAKTLLENIGCTWYFLSRGPIEEYESGVANIDSALKNLYQADLDSVRPNMLTVIFNGDWFSRPALININDIERKYKIVKGIDWPTWEKFKLNDFDGIKSNIISEIKETFKKDFVRKDMHPTPLESFLYLSKVLPELTISNATVEWAENIYNNKIKFTTTLPKNRF